MSSIVSIRKDVDIGDVYALYLLHFIMQMIFFCIFLRREQAKPQPNIA